ncbi:MAG: M13 family metallopeptidase [Ruminococcus sp.]|jgi:putative endopeptidase|nr:M13 family metallopeptidase [Ruminococcus sp.]
MKKILSVILVFILVLSVSTGAAVSAAPIDSDPTQFTNAEAAWALFKAADFYNPDVKYKQVLGDFDVDEILTTANAYTMVDRAFGELPEPNAVLRMASGEDPVFVDAPDDEIFTEAEFTKLVRRIYTLYGENLADDFYYTVNHDYFKDLKLQPGKTKAGVTSEAEIRADEQIAALLKQFTEGEFEQGTKAQKAADFYNAFLKIGETDVDITHLEGYFTAIDEAKKAEDIHSIYLEMAENLGYNGFMWIDVGSNFRADNKNIYFLMLPDLTLKYAEGLYSDPESAKIAEEYVTELFTLVGDSNPEANAAAAISYEKSIAEASLAPEDAVDMSKAYFVYTLEEVQEKIPSWDLTSILKAHGNEPSPDNLMFVPDDGRLAAMAKAFEPENIDTLKAFFKLGIIRSYRRYMGDSFRLAYGKFNTAMYGSEPLAKEDYYTQAATEEMNFLMQSLYTDYYVDPRTKADVEDMAEGIIDTFISRMDGYTWMSEEARTEAKKKLSSFRVVAAHPDDMHSAWDEIDVTSDNAFEIFAEYKKAWHKMDKARYGDDTDRNVNIMTAMKTYEINALFIAEYNIIYFPAAFLTTPYYDPNASLETNLGAIGTVMGHEITHAFDNNGSQFDSKGLVRNWWTEDDFAAFDGKVNDVIGHYEGYEYVNGIENVSAQTVSENIADIGGVSVALEYLKNNKEAPDYDAFFKSYAISWADIPLHQVAAAAASSDVHSGFWVRVNAVLPLFDEFYETYDIKKGDGMYIAPEDRVSIW